MKLAYVIFLSRGMECLRIGTIVPVPTMLFDVDVVCGSKRVNSYARLRLQVCFSGLWRRFVKVPARPLRGGCSCGLLVFVLVDDAVDVMKCGRSSLMLLGRRS